MSPKERIVAPPGIDHRAEIEARRDEVCLEQERQYEYMTSPPRGHERRQIFRGDGGPPLLRERQLAPVDDVLRVSCADALRQRAAESPQPDHDEQDDIQQQQYVGREEDVPDELRIAGNVWCQDRAHCPAGPAMP